MNPKMEIRAIEEGAIKAFRELFDDGGAAQDFLNDLIHTYRDAGTETVLEMRKHLATKNLDAVSKQAHKLKGLCRNIGANRLGHICQELELQAKNSKDLALSLFPIIEREFDVACRELEASYSHYFRAS